MTEVLAKDLIRKNKGQNSTPPHFLPIKMGQKKQGGLRGAQKEQMKLKNFTYTNPDGTETKTKIPVLKWQRHCAICKTSAFHGRGLKKIGNKWVCAHCRGEKLKLSPFIRKIRLASGLKILSRK